MKKSNNTDDFVHLNLHTDFSLGRGMCSIEGIASFARKNNMRGVAITDYNTMGGVFCFHNTLTEYGIKPVIGCELFISLLSEKSEQMNRNGKIISRIILLVQNETGYKNLCKICYFAYKNAIRKQPIVNRSILSENKEGLICILPSMFGEVSRSLLSKCGLKAAKSLLHEYIEIMGAENIYMEITDHGLQIEKIINKKIINLASKHKIPIIASNDIHYLSKDHANCYKRFRYISNTCNITSKREKEYYFSGELYFKTKEEMFELFKEIPEALYNTVDVTERCSFKFSETPDKNCFPYYFLPAAAKVKDETEYLNKLCMEGIQKRYGFNPYKNAFSGKEYKILKRTLSELRIIESSHFVRHYLIMHDIIKFAERENIPFATGLTNISASIVAYLIGISDIEPIKHNLFFKSYINPELRKNPPIIIDFCQEKRSMIFEYLEEKYGAEHTARIGVYGKWKRKILSENNDSLQSNDNHATCFSGLNRNFSIHSAALIISNHPIFEILPCQTGTDNNQLLTQFTSKECDDIGLLKINILGLRALTRIRKTLELIGKKKEKIDIRNIPLNDKAVFDLINSGKTEGLFQFDSPIIRKLCTVYPVKNFEDMVWINAISRDPDLILWFAETIEEKRHKPVKYIENCGHILNNNFEKIAVSKARIAAYTLISYRTAYLKAHYPIEFNVSDTTRINSQP